MIQCRDHITVARQLHICRGVALIISEGAVGEQNQRELLRLRFSGHGIVEMNRDLAAGSVRFERISP